MVEYIIEIAEISKDFHLYIVLGNKAANAEDAGFSEPIQVHSKRALAFLGHTIVIGLYRDLNRSIILIMGGGETYFGAAHPDLQSVCCEVKKLLAKATYLDVIIFYSQCKCTVIMQSRNIANAHKRT